MAKRTLREMVDSGRHVGHVDWSKHRPRADAKNAVGRLRMTGAAWRIATDTKDCSADDMSATGAKKAGGRWNAEGTPVVYASTSIAPAGLETLVHLDTVDTLPLNRYLVRVEIPDAVMWAAITADSPPVGWDADPASLTSIKYGQQWLRDRTSAVLLVPSVLVPEEYNVPLNPAHPDSTGRTAQKKRDV